MAQGCGATEGAQDGGGRPASLCAAAERRLGVVHADALRVLPKLRAWAWLRGAALGSGPQRAVGLASVVSMLALHVFKQRFLTLSLGVMEKRFWGLGETEPNRPECLPDREFLQWAE